MLSPSYVLLIFLIVNFTLFGEICGRETHMFMPTNSSYEQFLRIIHIAEDRGHMLVGSRGGFFNVTLEDMTMISKFEWTPTAGEVANCTGKRYFKDCLAYVMAAFKIDDNTFHLCGSSAKSPSCRDLVYSTADSNLTQGWNLLLSSPISREAAAALVPTFPWQEAIHLKTDEGLYSALNYFWRQYTDFVPLVLRHEPIEEYSKLIRGQFSKRRAIFHDPQGVVEVHFIQLFDDEDSVYVAFTEPTYETVLADRHVTSRLGRICKHDRPVKPEDTSTLILSTFFKATIQCGLPTFKPSGAELNGEEGHYGTFLKTLGAMTKPFEMDTDDQFVLGAFYSNALPNSDSAVCLYNLTAVHELFEQSDQLNVSSNTFDSVSVSRIINGGGVANPVGKCNNGTTGRDWRIPFLHRLVLPVGGEPIISVSGMGYRFTKVIVEAVRTVDSSVSHVIFLSTNNGLLLKYANISGQGYRLIEENDSFMDDEIKDLRSVEVDDTKYLLVNTLKALYRVRPEKCHRHKSCQDCVASQDPYCAWNGEKCVAVSTSTNSNRTLIQNLWYGVDERCPEPTTTTEAVTTTTTEKPVVEECDSDCKTGKILQQASSSLVTLYTLLGIVPIVMGIVGGAIGFKLARMRKSAGKGYREQHSHSDSEIVKSDSIADERGNSTASMDDVILQKETVVINGEETMRAKRTYL